MHYLLEEACRVVRRVGTGAADGAGVVTVDLPGCRQHPPVRDRVVRAGRSDGFGADDRDGRGLLGESIPPLQWLGAALVVGGVLPVASGR